MQEPQFDPRSSNNELISKADYQFELKPGEIGEAYHILICSLFYKYNYEENRNDGEKEKYKFKVCMEEPGNNKPMELEAFNDIRKLFKLYSIFIGSKGSSRLTVSKSKASDMVSALFRSHDQDLLWSFIQERLNNPKTDAPSISDTVEFCVEDYFKSTGQKLPEVDEVLSMAVIHVRRSAKTSVGRIMDDNTLHFVADSVAVVNEICSRIDDLDAPHVLKARGDRFPLPLKDKSKEKDKYVPHPSSRFRRFTHVIIYGDFNLESGKTLTENMATKHPTLRFSHITGPWQEESRESWAKFHVGKPSKNDNEERNKCYPRSNDIPTQGEIHAVPTQAKILGIWLAFRQRYRDKVCVIGHRSGFIEGAGLIGIPVFYLNNERHKHPGGNPKNEQGSSLWNRVPDAHGDRLRGLSDAVSTFIPVELLKASPPKKSEASDRRLEVDSVYKHELIAALFMYMSCVYVYDVTYTKHQNHAWPARIEMIHDACEHVVPDQCEDAELGHDEKWKHGELGEYPEKGKRNKKEKRDEKGKRDEKRYQTGQEWLRRRYEVAQDFVKSNKDLKLPKKLTESCFVSKGNGSWKPKHPLLLNWSRVYGHVWLPKGKTSTPPWPDKGRRAPSPRGLLPKMSDEDLNPGNMK